LDTQPASADGAARGVRVVAWTALGAAAVYTFVRAWRLKLDYYDTYVYLHNASRLLGEPVGAALDDRRPWLLSELQAPIVALARHLGPGNPWLLRGPHLLNAALSVGALAALVALYRRAFGTTLALVGGALFAAGPAFVHYGANTMTDIGVTGLCALALALHIRAVEARRLRSFALAGLVFGLAAGMKLSAPTFVVAILAMEAASLVELEPSESGRARARLRLDPRRRLGLVVEGLATLATFAAIELGAFARFYGSRAWSELRSVSMVPPDRLAGERWQDYLPMFVGIVTVPAVFLAAAGALAALARPRRADIPFAAWLVGMGGWVLIRVEHNEARYLLPVVPAALYFALRGVEAALALGARVGRGGARAAAGVVGLLVAASLAGGVAQAGADADPVFTRDVQGAAARALAAGHPGAAPVSLGLYATLTPATPGPFPEDEFWNAFHAAPFELSYLLGEVVAPFPAANGAPASLRDALFWRLPAGTHVARFVGHYFETRGFPKQPRGQALEVWTVRRHDLERGSVGELGGAAFVERRPTGTAAVAVTVNVVDLGAGRARASLVGVPPGGPWWVYTKTPKRTWAFAGSTDTPELALGDAADVDGLDLVRVDVERFE
jgi:hypothetical protein